MFPNGFLFLSLLRLTSSLSFTYVLIIKSNITMFTVCLLGVCPSQTLILYSLVGVVAGFVT